jgi:hypothetical protein
MMTHNRAITVLTRRATEFYGKTFEWLVDAMDNGFDENLTVTEAYKVYKMETNYVGS